MRRHHLAACAASEVGACGSRVLPRRGERAKRRPPRSFAERQRAEPSALQLPYRRSVRLRVLAPDNAERSYSPLLRPVFRSRCHEPASACSGLSNYILNDTTTVFLLIVYVTDTDSESETCLRACMSSVEYSPLLYRSFQTQIATNLYRLVQANRYVFVR